MTALLGRVARTAQWRRGDGLETVEIERIAPGDVLLIRAGEGVPVDGVVFVDGLDRIADAVHIAQRTRAIVQQSVIVGLGLSGIDMIAAAFGYLPPIAGALAQEVIDVAVVLNALRCLRLGATARA